MFDLKKEFEKQLSAVDELDENKYVPGQYSSKYGYYGKHEMIRDKAMWEISCALITRDWRRVRNALEILGADYEQDKAE